MTHACIILGTGPSALAAATILTKAGVPCSLFERRSGPGWKLLVAGSSGLNVTYDAPLKDFSSFYPARTSEISACLNRFPPEKWLELLRELGEEPYVGSSRRYFLKSKTAAQLLQSWTEWLSARGATFHYGEECVGIEPGSPLTARFASGKSEAAQTILLALGGASWESSPPLWPGFLQKLGLQISAFEPANAGYSFRASADFFPRAEGEPIKGLVLTTAKGSRQGELMITKYGLEGTPIYTMGCPGPATLDLKPDLAEEKLADRIRSANGTGFQKVENGAKLSRGALLLLNELSPRSAFASPESAAAQIKRLSIELLAPRPMSESISTRGGLSWDELDEELQCRKVPRLFCAGEMIDWDAPTGGFLIQACVSQGFAAGSGILKALGELR